MIDYFDSNGTSTDYWGSCNLNSDCKQYMERNLTAMAYHRIVIYQPCNYASNIAYYHVLTSIKDYTDWKMEQASVNALIQSYGTLTFGSAFWHGSQTYLGNVADNRLIDVVSYIAHQASLSNLQGSSIIHELSDTPRSKSGVLSNQELNQVLRTKPPTDWSDAIKNLDMPNYYFTFSALVTTMFNYLFSDATNDFIIPEMMKLFPLEDDVKLFILNSYLPELRTVTADVKISLFQKASLFFKVLGTIAKLFFAFLWQEWVFPLPLFKQPLVNLAGAYIMPYFNDFINRITGFTHTDDNLQNAENVYPGDTWCRIEQPHAKWHEESANGLLDLMFLADYMLELTL